MSRREGANDQSCAGSSLFIFKWVLSVIGFNKLWSVNLVSWFPGIVRFWIPFPLDEVLESSSPASVSMIDHFFHLIFFFSFDKVRGWPGIVRSVCIRFTIGR